ncbi:MULTISPECIES: Trm112 family protein [Arthrobacter]|uniref:Trm112 family protein n=1 Tax=Arthrobacter TaxID=1663 RepID=UPI0006DB0039|nr:MULTISPECIES: hypothetical protein [unclassified Arthrobacter]KPN17779.1 hypothetical protein AO716_07440 [Arthrobacter sp. Edens01]MSR98238.1 hypothetical protein [Arthrobacter sp. BL-252-APC-1A]
MANLTADLLDTLRCPQTHSRLLQEGNELVSSAPGPDGKPVRYAIEEGIPVLLPAAGTTAENTPN